MKVYWNKIPKCFKYASMDEDENVSVHIEKPTMYDEGYYGTWVVDKQPDEFLNAQGYPSPIDRWLVKDEEYELDGTEDWKESLQERPADVVCSSCKGNHTLFYPETEYEEEHTLVCNYCNGTGVEP